MTDDTTIDSDDESELMQARRLGMDAADMGLPASANPFDSDAQPNLRAAFASGHASGRRH